MSKTFSLPLADIQVLALAIAELDHVKRQAPADRACDAAELVEQGHAVLARALGDDAALIYAPDEVMA